ncbi:MAG: hypothetical protein AAGC93_17210 [Cyanobacteria bacterium P01_F01_bin.53]
MIVIREAISGDIRTISRIHVDVWRSTYPGIIPDKALANLSYEKREKAWHHVFADAPNASGFAYLAEDDSGQLVGFADGGRERTGSLDTQGS